MISNREPHCTAARSDNASRRVLNGLVLLTGLALVAAVISIAMSPAAEASPVNTITVLDDAPVSYDTAITVDDKGRPVVAYGDDYKEGSVIFARCSDSHCSDFDQKHAIGVELGTIVGGLSIVLDENFYPVIAYYAPSTGTINVARCTDRLCANGGTVEIPQPPGAGKAVSLALDESGFPVLAHKSTPESGDVVVTRCGDAACGAVASNEIAIPGFTSSSFRTSIAVDDQNRPVVAAHRTIPQGLAVVRCSQPDCAADDGVMIIDSGNGVGQHASMALDSEQRPVIAYMGQAEQPTIAACGNRKCTSDNAISILSEGSGGYYTSLALDDHDRPHVAYRTYVDNVVPKLMVAVCDTRACDDTIVIDAPSPDPETGRRNAIALDSDGHPIVAHHNGAGDGATEILHCATCSDWLPEPKPMPMPKPKPKPKPPNKPGVKPAAVCVEPTAGVYAKPYYTVITAQGHGYTYGPAPQAFNFAAQLAPGELVVDADTTTTGKGAIIVTTHGNTHAQGDAPNNLGPIDLTALSPGAELIGIALTNNGEGAWIGGSDGTVYNLNAPNFGDWRNIGLIEPLVDFKPSYPSPNAPQGTAQGGFYAWDASGGVFTSLANTGNNGHLVNPFWFSLWDFPGLGDLRPHLRGPVVTGVVTQPDCDRDLPAYQTYAVDGAVFNAPKTNGEEGYTTYCGSGVDYYATIYGEANIPAVGTIPNFIDGQAWGRHCQILLHEDGLVLVSPGKDPSITKWTPPHLGHPEGQLIPGDQAVTLITHTPPTPLLADHLGLP